MTIYEALDAEQPIVFGTGSGAVITFAAVEMVQMRSTRLILHKPAFLLLLPESSAPLAALQHQLHQICEAQGDSETLECFLLNADSDPDARRRHPELWLRLRINGAVFCDAEVYSLSTYLPDGQSEFLPVTPIRSERSPDFVQALTTATAHMLYCRL